MLKFGNYLWILTVNLCATCLRCELTLEDLPIQETNPDFSLVDDMILSPEQYDVLFNNVSKRTGFAQTVRMWPNSTVYYLLDDNFTTAEKSLIRAAQNIVQKSTCIKFERIYDQNSAKDYVHIKEGSGCASTVGFWGGEQIIYLQKRGCMETGKILHELVHLLGFFHMHSTMDRDKFIDIEWENIMLSAAVNFVIYQSEVSMFGTQFDYESITQYSVTAFSKNGQPTIKSKEPGGETVMGQRNHLSAGDVNRINRMYNCA